MRLDKYLKVSRLIKRRTVIQMGQKSLKVRVEQVSEVVRKEDAAGLYAVVSE